MICKVMYRKYMNGMDSGFYGGMEYAFKTELPLKHGDKVLVPSGSDNEPKRAIVVDIDVDPNTIEDWVLKILKPITMYDTEGGIVNG